MSFLKYINKIINLINYWNNIISIDICKNRLTDLHVRKDNNRTLNRQLEDA